MCGIFVVVGKTVKLDRDKCFSSLYASKRRGPDNSYYTFVNNTFIGCNVLSISGKPKGKYYENNNLFLAYNGEVYNFKPSEIPDTSNILSTFDTTESIGDTLKQLDGMFGIVLYDKSTKKLHIARDMQGEKTLYIYECNSYYIISSTISSINVFLGSLEIDYKLYYSYLFTRHFLSYNKTIYKNIRQVLPGSVICYNLTDNTHTTSFFKRIQDLYCESTLLNNSSRKYECILSELDELLDNNIKSMLPNKKFSVSFSGGIDSSLIAAYINKHTSDFLPIATNCIGKDYISSNLSKFQQFIKPKINTVDINVNDWYTALNEAYSIIKMPLPSHNYCTKLILTKYLAKNNIKVILGGEGADELFGGYNFYNYIDRNNITNTSPYSSFIDHGFDILNFQSNVVSRYLDYIWKYFYRLTGDNINATSLTDTFLVVADDGIRNSDQICGYYGIEGRSPFMRTDIIKFALNLPSKFKRGKPLLVDLFKKYYPGINIMDKQGFAGFPCETLHMFYKDIDSFEMMSLLGIKSFPKTPANIWKILNLQYFYESNNCRDVSINS